MLNTAIEHHDKLKFKMLHLQQIPAYNYNTYIIYTHVTHNFFFHKQFPKYIGTPRLVYICVPLWPRILW